MEQANIAKPSLQLLLLENSKSSVHLDKKEFNNCFGFVSNIFITDDYNTTLKELRTNKFDILLLDIDSLNDKDYLPRLCFLAGGALVITISEKNSVSLSLNAMSAGAHDHIVKPLDSNDFAKRVKKLALRYGKLTDIFVPEKVQSDFIGTSNNNISNLTSKDIIKTDSISSIKPMWQHEQQIIEDAINYFNGNISHAAQALEISPSTIYRKKQYWQEASFA